MAAHSAGCETLHDSAAAGHIINIASVAGLQGSKDEDFRAVAYHASKGGMIAMTRVLATI